jgi:toxin ParE1/3/4
VQVQITELATEDLIDIWLYGNETWGDRNADDYLNELDKAVKSLIINPHRYPENPDATPTFRLMPFRSHLIIYEVNEKFIVILRVLQKAMDTESKLKLSD